LKVINNITELTDLVEAIHSSRENKKTVVLIGGFARVGKTTLASGLSKRLTDKKIENQVICLDSWLISFDKRQPGSKVIERYHTKEMIKSLKDLIIGSEIFPPVFDSISRKQIKEKGNELVSFSSGVLIIEGTIALALKELFDLSSLKINIKINDCERIKRLIHFYKCVKELPSEEFKRLISDREKEEIPFIQEASRNADVIFSW
jgi:uridine kinase